MQQNEIMSKNKKLIPELRFPEFRNEDEWEKEKLANVSNVIMGSSPSSTSYNENNIGLPLLQGNTDIKNRLSSPRIYTTEITKECEVDDILLSVRAPVGTVAKSIHKACIGRGISALRALKPNSQEYLYQWLFSYESSWQKISQGGTFDAVNSDDIRNLLVPIPNPKEQQKIASCLSSLDEVIDAHNQKLERLKDHKKGLMQNLFPNPSASSGGEKVPKLRFEEFEKDGEWLEKSLDEVAEVNPTSFQLPNEFVYIDLESVENGTLLKRRIIKKEGAPSRAQRLLEKGDVIFQMVRPYQKNNFHFLLDDSEYVASTGYAQLRVFQSSEYLFQYLHTDIFVDKVLEKCTGSNYPAINASDLSKIPVHIPPTIEEQQKIASCLSALDELITAQAEKIEQLKQHKKGLMQGLFPKMSESRIL